MGRSRQTALVLVLAALPLAAIDLATKALLHTPAYAFHSRPLWQLVLGASVVALQSVVVPILGVRLVGAAAGVAIGGAAGNLLSAAIWGAVPNPIFLSGFGGVVALNLGDLFVIGGTFLLVLAVAAHAWGHRGRLTAPVGGLESTP